MTKFIYLILLAGALLLLVLNIPAECQNPQTKKEPSGFLLPQKPDKFSFLERKGKTLYDYYCSLCHGATGNGDGFNAYMLPTPPAKLADPSLMAKLSDEKIKRVIKEGGSANGLSPNMPSWGNLLKAKQIEDLAAYIRTFTKAGREK